MTDPGFERGPGLEALCDLSFTRFITVSVIKIIYLLGIVLLCLGWLFIVIAGFAGAVAGLGAIIVGGLIFLVYLLFLRVWLELIVVIFRIGENTSAMARAMGASPQTGGFPVTTHTPPAV